MVRSIVIPHDTKHPPLLRELPDAGAFQEAVDGWLDLIELPALGVSVYFNEAVRRDHAPVNTRAMALWWIYAADPTRYPILLGDVVLTGSGDDEESGDVPERLIRDVFGTQEFVVQAKPFGQPCWRDTYARFQNVFDAATWCMVLTYCLRPGALFRLRRESRIGDRLGEQLAGGDSRW